MGNVRARVGSVLMVLGTTVPVLLALVSQSHVVSGNLVAGAWVGGLTLFTVGVMLSARVMTPEEVKGLQE